MPLSEYTQEKLVASEVYTHLNRSIKPWETSSNSEKLNPDTLTARLRYTNQTDQGLESIPLPSGSNHVTGFTGRAQNLALCSIHRHPRAGAEGTYFLSRICL